MQANIVDVDGKFKSFIKQSVWNIFFIQYIYK